MRRMQWSGRAPRRGRGPRRSRTRTTTGPRGCRTRRPSTSATETSSSWSSMRDPTRPPRRPRPRTPKGPRFPPRYRTRTAFGSRRGSGAGLPPVLGTFPPSVPSVAPTVPSPAGTIPSPRARRWPPSPPSAVSSWRGPSSPDAPTPRPRTRRILPPFGWTSSSSSSRRRPSRAGHYCPPIRRSRPPVGTASPVDCGTSPRPRRSWPPRPPTTWIGARRAVGATHVRRDRARICKVSYHRHHRRRHYHLQTKSARSRSAG
mmetsp:Transcript_23304/g.56231  ORF Transcript_23304/g.56231 Transcript_23304/m.56231 type:complete len:259 (-) Transcript_23304:652-1428(-)